MIMTATKKTAAAKAPVKSDILEGLAMYAFLHSPDKGNPSKRILPSYKIDLMLHTDEAIKKAKSHGLNVKKPTDKHQFPYVTIKTKVREGFNGPTVVDAKNNPVPASVLIGNNSLVRVKFIPFTYGEGEVTALLQAVQVLELVPYERKPSFDVVDNGFTVAAVADEAEANDAI